MDKYDILFAMDFIKNKIKDFCLDRNELITRYTVSKLQWMRMEYYKLRTKKSAEYREKHGFKNISSGIQKVTTLNRRDRYAWQMFKPMEKK